MNEGALRAVLLGLGTLLAALSLWGVFAPGRLVDTVGRLWDRPWSLQAGVGIRLVLGLVILLVAEQSRFPLTFTVLGWITIVAGAGLLFMGRERVGRLLDRVAGWPGALQRAWCVFGVAFGAFLVYGIA